MHFLRIEKCPKLCPRNANGHPFQVVGIWVFFFLSKTEDKDWEKQSAGWAPWHRSVSQACGGWASGTQRHGGNGRAAVSRAGQRVSSWAVACRFPQNHGLWRPLPRRARDGSLSLGRDPLNGPGPRGDKAGFPPGSAHSDHNKGPLRSPADGCLAKVLDVLQGEGALTHDLQLVQGLSHGQKYL